MDRLLSKKEIDYNQNPEGVYMFSVGWFVELIGHFELSNELIERKATQRDYIQLITKYLPHHIDLARKAGRKGKITPEMKEYMKTTLIRGVNCVVEILKKEKFSTNQINTVNRNVEQIEKYLS